MFTKTMDCENNKISISYPLGLIEKMNGFPSNHAIPCSVLVGNDDIAGIFIVCTSQEIEYFKILSLPPPEPPLKFRMLNYKQQNFIVEIWMQFSVTPEKYLKIHLNPHDKSVMKLLELGVQTNMISFHFYDIDTHLVSSVVTGLDDEETDWFDRNYKLSTKLVSNQLGYENLAGYLCGQISSTDRVFKYYNPNKSNFFVREGGKQVILQKNIKIK